MQSDGYNDGYETATENVLIALRQELPRFVDEIDDCRDVDLLMDEFIDVVKIAATYIS